jgi:hypothetical protein
VTGLKLLSFTWLLFDLLFELDDLLSVMELLLELRLCFRKKLVAVVVILVVAGAPPLLISSEFALCLEEEEEEDDEVNKLFAVETIDEAVE